MPSRDPRRATLLCLVLAVWLCGAAFGDARIELQGGQQLSGTDLRLVGGNYLLELEPGKILTIPAELVRRVRLTGGNVSAGKAAEGAHPTGLTFTAPRQLAGGTIEPARRAEQLEVLGPPAGFSSGVIDPVWRPRGEWAHRPPGIDFNPARFADGVIDPSWIPRSGFRSTDVLRPGHATWRPDIIGTAWRPADGFEQRERIFAAPPKLSFGPPRKEGGPDVARTLAGDCAWCGAPRPPGDARPRAEVGLPGEPRPGDATHCARSIFERAPGLSASASIEIRELSRGASTDLPLKLHEATLVHAEGRTRAIFTTHDGACVLLAGDLRGLGLAETSKEAARYTRSAYDAALDRAPQAGFSTDDDAVRYAFGIAALAQVGAAGSPETGFVLLDDRQTLEGVLAREVQGCQASRGRQRRAARAATRAFEAPRVSHDAQGASVGFDAWSQAGGQLLRYAVRLSPGGEVSIARERLVEHVGRHDDR